MNPANLPTAEREATARVGIARGIVVARRVRVAGGVVITRRVRIGVARRVRVGVARRVSARRVSARRVAVGVAWGVAAKEAARGCLLAGGNQHANTHHRSQNQVANSHGLGPR